jgi:hypothetical protein
MRWLSIALHVSDHLRDRVRQALAADRLPMRGHHDHFRGRHRRCYAWQFLDDRIVDRCDRCRCRVSRKGGVKFLAAALLGVVEE